jgi:PEGA domain-containing protein
VTLESDPDDNLIAAAEAATSWARARRAKWTKEPLRLPEPPPPADELFEFEFEPQPAPPSPAPQPQAPPPLQAPPPPPRPVAAPPPPRPVATPPPPSAPMFAPPPPPLVHETQPPPARHAPPPPAPPRRRPVPALGAPLLKWAPRVAAAAALIVGAVVGAPYAINALSNLKTRVTKTGETRATPAAGPRTTATLNVTSTPPGAQVIVDGKPRGVTPLELTDVTPGRHDVALKSESGTVSRTVTVAADKTASIDEAIFSGFVAVYSPFEVTVSEAGRVLRPDDRNEIMLPPGAHDLRFINKTLGYDTSRQVEVKPGEGTQVRLTPEPSKLNVTATEPAEVWLDGTRVGEVPLRGVPAALGSHDLVLRRMSDGAERRLTITVGVAPFVLHVDFSRPGA